MINYLVYANQQTVLCFLFSLFLFTFAAHWVTMCSDPGYVKKPRNVTFMQLLQNFDPVLLCPDCEIVRTDRSRHCAICNQCVERFDHHCPWINSCVGTGNHGPFAVFILGMYTLLLSTAIVLLINLECTKYITAYRYPGMFLVPKLLP